MLLHPIDQFIQVKDFFGIGVIYVDTSASYDRFSEKLLRQSQVVLPLNKITESSPSELEIFGHFQVLVFEILFQVVLDNVCLEFCSIGKSVTMFDDSLLLERLMITIKVKVLAARIAWGSELIET